jgi:hypothetical protein
LSRYPAFIELAEQPEFQAILTDKEFAKMWQKQPPPPITELIGYSSVAAILKNPPLLRMMWTTLQPDLQDLTVFLTNGVSPKFDSEKILGRWDFDVSATISLFRKSKPNIPSSEMSRVRKYVAQGFSGTMLVAMPGGRVILKNYPHLRMAAGAAPTTESQTIEGQWRNSDGKYMLAYSSDGKTEQATVGIEGDRLVIGGQGLDLAFERED